jgi:hypothetical protein
MSEERIGADAEPRALAAGEPASTRASRQPPKSGDRTTTADTERIVRAARIASDRLTTTEDRVPSIATRLRPIRAGKERRSLRARARDGANPSDIAAADLDGDGKSDLAVTNAQDLVTVLINTCFP